MRQIMLVILISGLSSSVLAQQAFPSDSVSSDGTRSYHGNRITEDGAVSAMEMGQLTDKIDIQEMQDVKISGEVEAVCQAKGCWMTMMLPNEQELRVTFKDYGFFVPVTSSGKTAVIQGALTMDTTSVEDLRHYAVDGGMSEEEAKKRITEPKIGYSFLADGVIIKEQE